jgi:hypothetical protein
MAFLLGAFGGMLRDREEERGDGGMGRGGDGMKEKSKGTTKKLEKV